VVATCSDTEITAGTAEDSSRLECGQFEAAVLSSISSFAGSKQNKAKSAQVFELGFIPEKIRWQKPNEECPC
jgi:hypothetical protein